MRSPLAGATARSRTRCTQISQGIWQPNRRSAERSKRNHLQGSGVMTIYVRHWKSSRHQRGYPRKQLASLAAAFRIFCLFLCPSYVRIVLANCQGS